MNKLLNVLSDMLNSEVSGGGFGLFVKTAFNFLYRTLIQGSVRRDTEKSINDILKLSREAIEKNIREGNPEFEDLLERFFPSYLQSDSIFRLGKRRHKNFGRVENEIKNVFRWYVTSSMDLLIVEKDNISTFDELYKASYPTKKEGLIKIRQQFDILMHILSIVEEDLNILSVPVSRKLLYNILMKGYLRTIDEIEKEIEDMYS